MISTKKKIEIVVCIHCKENKRKVFQTYDLPLFGQTTLQDPSTKVAMEIVRLNQTVNFYLILILSFVTWIAFVGFLLSFFMLDNAEEDTVVFWKTQIMSLLQRRDQTVLELVWTLVPAIVLVLLAIPSFTLLYQAEEKSIDYKSISVVGHQWYWEYFYPVPKTIKSNLTWYNNITSIDTYVKLTALIADYRYDSLAPRLIGTTETLVVPSFTPIKFFVTANDVIHSFAIPVAGLKMDAVPGRLNAITTVIERESIFHGACSELCGVNHGFMPITGISVNPKVYESWLNLA